MFNYAQVVNGVVVGVQQSENAINKPELINIESFDGSFIGKLFDGEKFTDAPKPRITKLTNGAFGERFTLVEKVALEMATENDIEVKVLMKDMDRASHIDIDYLPLQQGVAMLVNKGIIEADRIDALLADGTPDEAA